MVENIIIIGILSIMIAGAIAYIVSAKKKGQKCIGCPHANSCQKKC